MPLTEDGDRLAHDPAVDGRHEAMALRLREEGVGGLHTPMLVRQAQQNLAPRTCRVLRRQGYDRLRVQLKVALVHRSGDRKSTRLNSSHITISYAVFCLKKKKKKEYMSNMGPSTTGGEDV